MAIKGESLCVYLLQVKQPVLRIHLKGQHTVALEMPYTPAFFHMLAGKLGFPELKLSNVIIKIK